MDKVVDDRVVIRERANNEARLLYDKTYQDDRLGGTLVLCPMRQRDLQGHFGGVVEVDEKEFGEL